jgi:acyl-CoA thioester hydrolase
MDAPSRPPVSAESPALQRFERAFVAGWGDMDFNAHMRNTSFLDRSADVRMMFFADQGFPMEEFVRRRLGPVIRSDEIQYFKELRLLEPFRVTLGVAGLSDDGSRFLFRNEFWRTDDTRAAVVTSAGGWLDLQHRKLVPPPEALLSALRSLTQTDDFQVLAPSIKAGR